jgi:hypothetical protein
LFGETANSTQNAMDMHSDLAANWFCGAADATQTQLSIILI